MNVGTATGYLDLDITSFMAKLNKAQDEAMTKTESMGKRISSKLDKVGGALEKTGKTMTYGLTVPIIGAGAAMVKSAVSYESAFAGVRKTVDATEEEFAQLSDGIRKMSRELPASAESIAEVTEAAGQLGIENDNLLEFTKVMIDLGESTNMSATTGATQLARFANITQMSQKDFDRLGSVVVDLGNNFATTEAEIVDMALNLAGAGSQVGLTEAEIMALATTLSSVGIEAAAGGTSFSKLLINMSAAAQVGGKANEVIDSTGYSLRELQMMSSHSGKEFGELAKSMGYTRDELQSFVDASATLEGFSKVTGMTADQFKQAFEEDAVGALQTFISGLQEAGIEGESVIGILDEMGITEVRLRDAILRAAGAGDLLSDAVKVGSEAWDENNALTQEAAQRYETTESKLLIMKNNLIDAGRTLGNYFIPVLRDVSEKIMEWVNKFDKLDDSTKQFIVKLALVVAAIGPVLLVTGKLMKSVSSIIEVFGKLKGIIPKITGLFKLKGASMMSVIAPAAKVIGVVGLLVAAFVSLWKSDEGFRGRITAGWNKLKGHFAKFFSAIEERIGSFKEIFSSIVGHLKKAWEDFTSLLAPVFEVAWAAITNALGVVLDVIIGLLDIFIGIFTGDWSQAWEGVKGIFTGIWDGIVGFVTDTLDIIDAYFGDFIDSVVAFFSELPGKIWTFITETIDSVKQWGIGMWESAKETGKNFLDSIEEFFTDLPYKVGFFIGETLGKIIKWGIDTWDKAKETGRNFINAISEFFSTLPGKVQDFLSRAYNNITIWASNTWTKAKEAGRNFVEGTINFIKTLPSRIWTWLVDSISKLTTWGSNMSTKGREAGTKLVNAAVGAVKSLPGRMASFGGDVVRGFWNGIVGLGDWIRSKVHSFFSGIIGGVKSVLGIASPSKVFADLGMWSAKGVGVGFEKEMPHVQDDVEDSIDKAFNNLDTKDIELGIVTEFDTIGSKVKSLFSALDNWLDKVDDSMLQSSLRIIKSLDHIITRANSLSSLRMVLEASSMGLLDNKLIFQGMPVEKPKESLFGGRNNNEQVANEPIDYKLLAETMVDVFNKSKIKVDAYLNARKVTDEINEENARREDRRL